MSKKNKRTKADKHRKSNEIWKIGYDGLPEKFKIVRWNNVQINGKDDQHHLEYIPIYEKCVCCNLSLGRLEEERNVELSGYCLGCFKNVTDQKVDQQFGEFLCTSGLCNQEISLKIKDPIKIEHKQSRSVKKRRQKFDRF